MDEARALPVDSEYGALEEAALVQAARARPEAFGELYSRYLTRVYRYMRSRSRSEEDAADLTQQVFLQSISGLSGYRGDAPFAAWLFRIARNVAADASRRRPGGVSWDSLPEALHPVGEGDPEAAVLRRERLARLRDQLAELEPEKRELLALRFVARLKAREIATVTGKSEAAVQKALQRTLHSLEEGYRDG